MSRNHKQLADCLCINLQLIAIEMWCSESPIEIIPSLPDRSPAKQVLGVREPQV